MTSKCLLITLAALALLQVNAVCVTTTILHNFNATPNGNEPFGGVIEDASGNLYGTSSAGGGYGFGTVFKLTPNSKGGWNQSVLYSFKGGNDGSAPVGAMVFDGAGNLYGITSAGGGLGVCYDANRNNIFCGTLFKLTPVGSGWTESVLYRFDDITGGSLSGGLVFDAAGNLYSTTYNNGSTHGSVFQLAFSSGAWTDNILHSFTGQSDGDYPKAPLVLDQAGNVYGTAGGGGTAKEGLVFELSPSGSSWTETVLYNFVGGTDGAVPSSGVVFDSSGNLYGGTASGGGSGCGVGCGVIFKLTSSPGGQWTESVIYAFSPSSMNAAVDPIGLVFDQTGNLYGSTYNGGACDGCGLVFELAPGGGGQWTETTLWKFTAGADGQYPSSVITNSAGKIFGTTSYAGDRGNGTVFQVAKGSGGKWTETTIFDFPYSADGQYPEMPLISDTAGNLYGTAGGGIYGHGVVFELIPQPGGGWKEKTLYSFPNDHEYIGPDGLAFDSQGNLFGITGAGGTHEYGTLFELSPAPGGGWTYQTLYEFVYPDGGPSKLVMDNAGHVFISAAGGRFGEIFELTRGPGGTWIAKIIHKFIGYPTDGAYPNDLILDEAGNLYGTTENGGSGNCTGLYRGCGTVFELSPIANGWTETLLYQFTNLGLDGSNPVAGVIFDQLGNLYGTTSAGGKAGCNYPYTACGTVFELSPLPGGGWSETTIYAFNTSNDGNSPFGGLVFDQQGNLYGTTLDGGSSSCGSFGCGIVFELSPASGGSWTETILHAFGAGNGGAINPRAGLIIDSAGNLYGTTESGGKAGQGTVFEIQP